MKVLSKTEYILNIRLLLLTSDDVIYSGVLIPNNFEIGYLYNQNKIGQPGNTAQDFRKNS